MMTIFAQASAAAQPLRRSDNLLPGAAAEPLPFCAHACGPASPSSKWVYVGIEGGHCLEALHLTR